MRFAAVVFIAAAVFGGGAMIGVAYVALARLVLRWGESW